MKRWCKETDFFKLGRADIKLHINYLGVIYKAFHFYNMLPKFFKKTKSLIFTMGRSGTGHTQFVLSGL